MFFSWELEMMSSESGCQGKVVEGSGSKRYVDYDMKVDRNTAYTRTDRSAKALRIFLKKIQVLKVLLKGFGFQLCCISNHCRRLPRPFPLASNHAVLDVGMLNIPDERRLHSFAPEHNSNKPST